VRRLLLLLLAAAPGCAAPGSEIHLAPFYARHATARGTVEQEALGGLWHRVEERTTGTPLVSSVRPFWSWRNLGGGDWHADVLAPFGIARRRDGEMLSYVIPLYIYRNGQKLDGTRETRWASLPGVMVRNNSERGLSMGWFPFLGKLETFLTYQNVVFVLWPLYVSADADGRHSTHFLWPILGWTTGGGETSFRFLPFWSHARREGRYDRHAVLWPFLQHQRNHLGGGGEEPETIWWFWPFYGRAERGTYRSHTVLWPFFGYASDPRGDFTAIDAPWPLVRFQQGGENTPVVKRRRIWPFFGYVEADKLRYWTYLWPFVHVREERYLDTSRDSTFVFPFWQTWDREELSTGRRSAWRKLWPLYQWERDGELVRGSFPSLDPFARNHLITYNYGWLWRVWSWEDEGDVARRRAWLDLYRGEADAGEDRRSLAFLWARREYVDPDGAETAETSLLLGLLRWRRNERDGFAMLKPAFPGPGWPAERAAPPAAGPAVPLPAADLP
jgi:hypothetical protein